MVGRDTVEELLRLKTESDVLLSSTRYLAGLARFWSGGPTRPCQAGRKYFSIDPYGYVHPCVDGPRVGHVLAEGLAAVRSAQTLRLVESCRGCWYCFRGEADSTFTLGGYFERLRTAVTIVANNGKRALRRRARPRGAA